MGTLPQSFLTQTSLSVCLSIHFIMGWAERSQATHGGQFGQEIVELSTKTYFGGEFDDLLTELASMSCMRSFSQLVMS